MTDCRPPLRGQEPPVIVTTLGFRSVTLERTPSPRFRPASPPAGPAMAEPDSFDFDVFLSHSSKDKPIVRPIAERLRNDGLRVWFDEWEIKPGESITGGIEKGLQECDVFLLMWSAAAKASKWVDTELRAAIRKRVEDAQLRLVPIMVDNTPLIAPRGLSRVQAGQGG